MTSLRFDLSGIKSSYNHLCSGLDDVEGDDLGWLASNLIQVYLKEGADKFAVNVNHKIHLLRLGHLFRMVESIV